MVGDGSFPPHICSPLSGSSHAVGLTQHCQVPASSLAPGLLRVGWPPLLGLGEPACEHLLKLMMITCCCAIPSAKAAEVTPEVPGFLGSPPPYYAGVTWVYTP